MRIHRGTLSSKQEKILFDAGFTDKEIRIFDQAKQPNGEYQPAMDIDNPVWKEAIRERSERVRRIQEEYIKAYGKPLRREWQSRRFNQFYTDKKMSDPFDWLKVAYKRIHHLSGNALKKAVRRLQDFPSARKYIVKESFD